MMTESNAVIAALQQKFGSADWSMWEMRRWPFYDYVRYSNGVNELVFFGNPRGATDPVSSLAKTYEQTNMDKGRSFGQVYYMITQIRTHIHILPKNRQLSGISSDADVITTTYSDMMPELEQLAGQGVLLFDILAKRRLEIEQPFQYAPPGMGVNLEQHASQFAAAAIGESLWFQQSPIEDDCFTLSPPAIIEPEQVFDLRITFPNGASPTLPTVSGAAPAVDIGVLFDGYIFRPAQ